jgi:hypothetical protein
MAGGGGMKNCTRCAHADWKKTAAGKLHPLGNGRCTFPYVIPKLPACRYFITFLSISEPFINRKKELKEDCVYFLLPKAPKTGTK